MTDEGELLMTGYLYKQGGSYRNWTKRYFILKGNLLNYYKSEGVATVKGVIDLKSGFGIRRHTQCAEVQWPKEARPDVSFGIATESRTFYLYGLDKAAVRDWMITLQRIIEQVGTPKSNWKDDPEGKPESALSKAVKGSAKIAARVTKMIAKESGVVDEDLIEGVAEAVENQADASRDASVLDRLQMAGGDSAGLIADNVDNEALQGEDGVPSWPPPGSSTLSVQLTQLDTAYPVSTSEVVGMTVAQEQFEAEDDVSFQQRLVMAAGTSAEGASEMMDNDIASGALGISAGMAKDQCDADEDASLTQRLVLAGGSVTEGASELTDHDVVSGGLEVAGGVAKEQAEADQDTSITQRIILAGGGVVEGSSAMAENDLLSAAIETAGGIVKDQSKLKDKASAKERAGSVGDSLGVM